MSVTLKFSSTGFISAKLIEWYTWSEYSHVDLVLPDGNLLGSRFIGGVKIRKPRKFKRELSVVIHNIDEQNIIELLQSQIGKPYDHFGIIGIPLRSRRWQDEDSWFCSELIAWAFDKNGTPLVNSNSYRVTPRDLLESPLCKPIYFPS